MVGRLFSMAISVMGCAVRLQSRDDLGSAAACVPAASSSPPVVDQLVTFVIGTDGLRMVLNASERLADMIRRHENWSVLRIAEIPGERAQLRASLGRGEETLSRLSGNITEAYADMKRVILCRSNISSICVHVVATVRDRSNESVSWLLEPVDFTSISQTKALEAKTNA